MGKPRAATRRLYPHEIENKLKSISRHVATGADLKSACQDAGVSVASYYRWRARRRETGTPTENSAGVASATREKILRAAATAFLRDGWDARIVDVAAAAGVTRQTVYNLYGTRDNLFGEVVGAQYAARLNSVRNISPDLALPEALTELANQQLAVTLDPDAVAMLRITQTEFRKNPRLASIAYAMRSSRDAENIMGYLERRLGTEIEKGTIEAVDTRRAAETFICAVTGPARHRVIHGMPQYSDAYITDSVAFVVDLFLRGLRYDADENAHGEPPALDGSGSQHTAAP